MKIDTKLDLELERTVDVSPALVWKAWTEPEHVKKWFCPAPWTTPECEIDLRPGGMFRTVLATPEGERFPNMGCYLEVVPEKKLVWTTALETGFRPATQMDASGFVMTAAIIIEPAAEGTKYTAIVMHANEATREKHEAMGFRDGWGKALDQLVEHMKTQK